MDGREQNIDAIHERDIDKILKQEGLLDAFQREEILCKFCKTKITKENIYSILPESGAFNFICQKSECVANLLEHLDNKTT